MADVLLQAGDTPPAGEAPRPGNPFDSFIGLLWPMLLIFGIFWLLIFRPESKKRKERERRISSLKKGDTVVTIGGIVGKVWRVDPGEVVLTIDKDKDVRVRFTKSSVHDLVIAQPAKGESSQPEKAPEEAAPS
jgi:preprotein translocase subunit YajC